MKAQPCGGVQSLSSAQKIEINNIASQLDAALKQEHMLKIDSLNQELKKSYASQAGIPDAKETYFTLTSNEKWIDLSSAILLSRQPIAKDSLAYVNLWKLAKGMSPPLYKPNSIFLRVSAETAVGLLKIADKENDARRKTLYQGWAIAALDSLATMQLPNGAFPFPDLRTYGDPVFSPIIQKFLIESGDDSVNVLKNGWIADDRGTGEFKFDAGVIADAY
ncbi:MAG TPA: hypothetical protein VF691_22560, partial [Cytophagaceae bacterium]